MVSGTPNVWSLHPQLAQDTVPIGDLALARVLLANDANFPWLILVPRRPGLVELIDLEENAQVQLLGEMAAAAHALKAITECEKLNIAALGNQVAQLHVHVIGRRHGDAAWPKPVWGAAPPIAYVPTIRNGLIGALRRALQIERVHH
jgi:diadenosine tetraphosphate (Ap4A) HIT family hydrolase